VTYRMAAGLGVIVWGGLFLLLLVVLAIETDLEKRWDRAWAEEWERRNGTSIDVLVARLDGQLLKAHAAGRALNWVIGALLFMMAGVAFLQFSREILTPDGFKGAMFFGVMVTGLLFLPLRAAAEVWLGLVRSMRRQVRVATDERLVVERGTAVAEIPKLVPEKKKPAPAAQSPAPALTRPAGPAKPATPARRGAPTASEPPQPPAPAGT